MVAIRSRSSRPLTGVGDPLDLGDGRLGRPLDAALDQHRVGASGDVAEALGHHRLGQDGRGGGAVAGDVVRLRRGLLEHLGAHVLERVLELDLLGDGHAVMGDGRADPTSCRSRRSGRAGRG